MSEKRGRRGKYEEIKELFPKIKEWLENGLTERQVAKNLGIAYSTFNRYKSDNEEFKELIKKARNQPVIEMENAMFMAATGYTRVVKKAIKVKDIKYENGKKVRETEKVVMYDEEEYFKPDITAGIYLLKHWGKGYTNDPQMLELRKRELELRKQQIDQNNW